MRTLKLLIHPSNEYDKYIILLGEKPRSWGDDYILSQQIYSEFAPGYNFPHPSIIECVFSIDGALVFVPDILKSTALLIAIAHCISREKDSLERLPREILIYALSHQKALAIKEETKRAGQK